MWTPEADDPMPIFPSFPTGHTFRHSMSGGTNSAATRCCGVCGCPWNCWRNADGGKGGGGNSWGAAWCGWKPPVVVSLKMCRCSANVATYPTAKSYLVQYSLPKYLSVLSCHVLPFYQAFSAQTGAFFPQIIPMHPPNKIPIGDVRWRRNAVTSPCKGDIRRYDDANDIDIRIVTNMMK